MLSLSGADLWGWGPGALEADTTQGVAVPMAAVGAAAEGPLAMSFCFGLGVRVMQTVGSCLHTSH